MSRLHRQQQQQQQHVFEVAPVRATSGPEGGGPAAGELDYMPEKELEEFIEENGQQLNLTSPEIEFLHIRRRRLSVERVRHPSPGSTRCLFSLSNTARAQSMQPKKKGSKIELLPSNEVSPPFKIVVLGDEESSGPPPRPRLHTRTAAAATTPPPVQFRCRIVAFRRPLPPPPPPAHGDLLSSHRFLAAWASRSKDLDARALHPLPGPRPARRRRRRAWPDRVPPVRHPKEDPARHRPERRVARSAGPPPPACAALRVGLAAAPLAH